MNTTDMQPVVIVSFFIIFTLLALFIVLLFTVPHYIQKAAKQHHGRVFAHKGVILTYTLYHEDEAQNVALFLDRADRYAAVETTLKQVIDANPQADLTKLERTLHIKILDLQRKATTTEGGDIYV